MTEGRAYDDYLSEKAPSLSAPGTRVSDLYYSYMNSTVEVLESTCDWSNKISLTSLSFGSQNQVMLPMNSFVGQLILHLRLPNLAANQTVCRGWGLRMIKSIRFQFGTSTSTPIILTQQAIWHQLFASCSTEEKRSELFRQCGIWAAGPLAVPPNTGTLTYPGAQVPTLDAFVPIPVPFSQVCEKLMFDTTMLGQPISLIIEFETNARAIYGGNPAPPTAFLIADLLVRQQRLADQSKSLSTAMKIDPNVMYSYPFIQALGFETNGPFTGSTTGNTLSVQLNQFQNSDLLGIVFCVQRVFDLSPAGNDVPNPFHLDPITDVRMTYNGAMIMQYPGLSYRAISTFLGKEAASFYQNSYSYLDAGTGNIISIANGFDEYLVFFDFTQERACSCQDHMSNTWRIPPGNVLTVSFNTQAGNPVQYRCFYTCFYNATVVVQAGVSNVLTA